MIKNLYILLSILLFVNVSYSQSNEDFNYVTTSIDGVEFYVYIEKDTDYTKEIWVKGLTPTKTIKNKKGKYVTVGGAISSDIHGKDHLSAGGFSNYVLSFKLLCADGAQITCSRIENETIFWATLAGYGLMGIILEATFRLKKIPSAYLKQTTGRMFLRVRYN